MKPVEVRQQLVEALRLDLVGPDHRPLGRLSLGAVCRGQEQSNARLYVGVAAQGRSPKVVMLRVYLTVMAAAQKAYVRAGPKGPRPTRPIPT